MALRLWSSAQYTFPLPHGHRFPVEKYALLRERVLADGIVPLDRLHDPARATDEELRRVHAERYVSQFARGKLPAAEMRRIGFPWSPELVERSYRAVGGTLAAARHAMADGIGMNLAGGTHHAFPDHGEGFCVFNDVAIAIRALQQEGVIRRAAVVDLDVHQGNGTHAVFDGDDDVLTFSMHGARNYPFDKVAGSLDIELPDGTGDDAYLAALHEHLPPVLADAAPDVVFYVAGADPLAGDRLGRLALTHDGLARRDTWVLERCREVGLPVVITIGGGYAPVIEETVQVHVNTARIAAAMA